MSQEPIDVALLFDVEDIFSPPEVGNDDSIKELATILTEEGLPGIFLFIGDRAQLLKERGRQDVIDSLARHDVGLHTRSARHPCSPEYVQRKSWHDGVAEALRHEREGAQIIQDVFGRPTCALSTHNWFGTPHSQHAAAVLGLPYVYAFPAAPPLYSLSWYAGALGLTWDSPRLDGVPHRAFFSDFDNHYHHDAAFDAQVTRFDAHIETCVNEGQPFLSLLLYHPQRVRLADFIDRYWAPDGRNYPKEEWGSRGQPLRYPEDAIAVSLANFRRLVRRIRQDSRLRPLSMSEIVHRYGSQPREITFVELTKISSDICATNEILLHDRFSPAEILVALATAVVHVSQHRAPPASVPRMNVLGPVQNLIYFPETLSITWSDLVRDASELTAHVASKGHLPAMLGKDGQRVGVNHLYRALAGICLAIAQGGQPPDEISLRPMPRYPALAEQIGMTFARVAEGGLMHPDLDVDALYRHGKLQTWTLKPAIRT